MTASRRLEVLIAGGGVAAAECVLALRALAGDRVAITLLAPQDALTYRAWSVAKPFRNGTGNANGAATCSLAALASEFDVHLVHDFLAWVAPSSHVAFTEDWTALHYDVLVMATGAERRSAYPHGIAFRGDQDAPEVRALLERLESGASRSVAFVAPVGAVWTLPLYELALMTAEHVRGARAEISLVTHELAPLELFGDDAGHEVARLLDEAGIGFVGGAEPDAPEEGRLAVGGGHHDLAVDELVSMPVVVGRRVRGLPTDDAGFLRITPFGHVIGVKDVYAAGDGTSFPIKQGGVACQQADVVAESIARRAGADITPTGHRPVLRGMLLTGDGPRFLRHAGSDGSQVAEHTLWWPPSKVAGRYLAPYLGEALGADGPAPEIRRRAVVSTGRDGGRVELRTLGQASEGDDG